MLSNVVIRTTPPVTSMLCAPVLTAATADGSSTSVAPTVPPVPISREPQPEPPRHHSAFSWLSCCSSGAVDADAPGFRPRTHRAPRADVHATTADDGPLPQVTLGGSFRLRQKDAAFGMTREPHPPVLLPVCVDTAVAVGARRGSGGAASTANGGGVVSAPSGSSGSSSGTGTATGTDVGAGAAAGAVTAASSVIGGVDASRLAVPAPIPSKRPFAVGSEHHLGERVIGPSDESESEVMRDERPPSLVILQPQMLLRAMQSGACQTPSSE